MRSWRGARRRRANPLLPHRRAAEMSSGMAPARTAREGRVGGAGGQREKGGGGGGGTTWGTEDAEQDDCEGDVVGSVEVLDPHRVLDVVDDQVCGQQRRDRHRHLEDEVLPVRPVCKQLPHRRHHRQRRVLGRPQRPASHQRARRVSWHGSAGMASLRGASATGCLVGCSRKRGREGTAVVRIYAARAAQRQSAAAVRSRGRAALSMRPPAAAPASGRRSRRPRRRLQESRRGASSGRGRSRLAGRGAPSPTPICSR